MVAISSVVPSGAARATRDAPMVPPAPPAFSTTTVMPVRSPRRCAIRRDTTSVAPPAAKGTTMVTGPFGNADADDCAKEAGIIRLQKAAAAVCTKRRRDWVLRFSMLMCLPRLCF